MSLGAQLQYWTEQLADAPRNLALPYQRSPASSGAGRRARVEHTLTDPVTAGVRTVAESARVPVSTVMLAALRVLLARYAYTSDLCIGMPASGTTLVLRGRVLGDDDFLALLAREQHTVLGALAHPDIAWDQLVGALGIEGSSARMPLVPVGFVDRGATSDPDPLESPRFDLELETSERGTARSVAVLYDDALFHRDTILELVARYDRLLGAITADPQLRLSALELLDADETARFITAPALAVRWDAPDLGVLEQIERVMAETPDSTAVVFGDRSLTYRALDEASSRLAATLRELGVGTDHTVAVIAERGLPYVTGVIAVLRAGGAFVSIKPDLPDARIQWLLGEVAPTAVLSDGPPRGTAGATPMLRLDAPDSWSRAPWVPPTVPGDALAYITYTSGSTGQPKGVMVTRDALSRQMSWHQRAMPLTTQDRGLQLHSIMFDAAVSEVFWPLATGGLLVLPKPGFELDARYLGHLIEQTGVSVMQFVPSMMTVLLETLDPARWTSVRILIAGGEALTPELAQRCRQSFPNAVLSNAYGPTETTINATWTPVDEARPLSIGHAVADTTALVLDANFAPVPPDGAGELWLGGAQLARGYRGRPDLTAERFVPDPFASRPGQRLYRTGDVVRLRRGGDVDFMGRADAQVKIRGFRIELGEIEVALSTHPDVRDAVVIATSGSHPRLIAYVVGRNGEGILEPALREHLAATLAPYMLPSRFVILEQMPLTSSGKVDRRALPLPDRDDEPDAAYAAPTSPEQALVAALFAEVLNVERVGIHDDLMALGGDSLDVFRVLGRIRQRTSVEIPSDRFFQAPTVAAVAALIVELGPRELGPIPVPRSPEQRLERQPLSYGQQRLWFIQQLDLASPAYNMPSVFRIEGPLDAALLARCVEAIQHRHEALRTAFPAVDGLPSQRVSEPAPLAVPLHACPPGRDRDDWIVEEISTQTGAPFDLERGPLLRAAVLRLSDEEHLFVLTMHHIITDGWSGAVFVRELDVMYGDGVAGRAPTLLPLTLQYPDYADWQRRWLERPQRDQQLAYWRTTLSGTPIETTLPLTWPRPPVPTHEARRLSSYVSPEEAAALHAFRTGTGCSVFMVWLAALRAAIYRYTQQEDVCLGVPVASRQRGDFEDLIGLFVNTIALRGSVTGDSSFSALCEAARRDAIDAYANQDVPFDAVVEVLDVPRRPNLNPLFQIMYAHQNTPRETGSLGPLVMTEVPSPITFALFDLLVETWELPDDRIRLDITFNTALFSEPLVRDFSDHLRRLVVRGVQSPATAIGAITLVDSDEKQDLLALGHGTERAIAGSPLLHGLLEEQARRAPEAIALIHGHASLTYGELLRRSTQLSHRLRSRGVRAGHTVAIAFERSIDMIVAMYGVLAAGAAILPLDLAQPATRLQHMLSEAEAPLLITHSVARESARALNVPTVVLDTEPLASESDHPLPHGPATSRAYVLFTSGSTGRPKGVMIEHHTVVNALHCLRDDYSLTRDDRVLHKTPYTFDVSMYEIYLAGLLGAPLIIAEPRRHGDPQHLRQLIREQRITCVHFVPSMLAAFLGDEPGDDCRSLRHVFAAGEALSLELVRWTHAVLPGVGLHNLYGPTEAGYMTEDTILADATRVPIGRAIANTRLYALDALGEPVPHGALGELYIAGPCLALGYIARPDLTAERFVPCPFGPVGDRMYRTGDLVRFLDGQRLAYLGRVDQQVKLRGFRIELGEIEAVVASHPGVAACAVALLPGPAGAPCLVAYVQEGRAIDSDDLRHHAAARLPDYMVPTAFVPLASLPMTTSGKVDRRALPAPAWSDLALRRHVIAPRNDREAAVLAILCELLGRTDLGVEDDFFQVGGNSLLALTFLARIKKQLRRAVPLLAFLDKPTAAGVARVMEGLTDASPTVHVTASGEGRARTVFMQEDFFRAVCSFPELAGLEMATEWRLEGELIPELLCRAVEIVCAEHGVLHTTFERDDSRLFQRIVETGPRCPYFDHVNDEAGAETALRAYFGPLLALDRGETFRVAVARTGTATFRLVCAVHHITSDHPSFEIFLSEVERAYDALKTNPATTDRDALAPLPFQFVDVARHLRAYESTEPGRASLAFWTDVVAKAPPVQLPVDFPRDAVDHERATQPRGCRATFPYGVVTAGDPTLGRDVLRAPTRGATTLALLIAAVNALVNHETGQRDVCVTTSLNLRSLLDAHRLIGGFNQPLYVLSSLHAGMCGSDLITNAQQALQSAIDHSFAPIPDLMPRTIGMVNIGYVGANESTTRSLAGAKTTAKDFARPSVREMYFDLRPTIAINGDALAFALAYNTRLFRAETVQRLAESYVEILRGLVRDPARSLIV